MVRTKAGKLRHAITITTATLANDSAGQPVATWATLYSGVPMELAEQAGTWNAGKPRVVEAGTLLMRIRWLTGITVKQRVTWDSRTFEISSADDPDGTRNQLLLKVVEVR